jgi:hypothetical protein
LPRGHSPSAQSQALLWSYMGPCTSLRPLVRQRVRQNRVQ